MIILLLLCAYLLGNLLTAQIVSNVFLKKEIRNEGSGNPGARNIGRVFGKKAFVATFIGDATKGALAVFAANYFGFGTVIELLALLAVTVGHIYPVFNKFQGGKGVSTFIGGILAFNPVLVILLVGVFLIIYPFTKSFSIAGFVAIIILPFGVFMRYGDIEFMLVFALVALLLFAHRDSFKWKRGQANN